MIEVKSREKRRGEALQVADACTRMLKERYGARAVYLFGSARGDGPWHGDSDLDLAVEGLSCKEVWRAGAELERMAPSWLEVDLVPLDNVYPEVRAHILGEVQMPENAYLALRMRLEDELIGLGRVSRGLTEALTRVGSATDEFGVRALASYLDDIYKSCEMICECVAVTLDGGLPEGERWHYTLLLQMSQTGSEECRPPLFCEPLLSVMDEYRRFRHRVRHIYGYELEARRVLELAKGAEGLVAGVREAVAVFNLWLEQKAGSEMVL